MAKTEPRGGQIKDGSLTDADVAAANKDGVAGTPSLRTLGTGAQQAAAGVHKDTHKHGGADEVATATPAANAIPKAGAGNLLDKDWLPDVTTADKGAMTAADKDFGDSHSWTGHVSGGEVTKATGLTVDVAAGVGWIGNGAAPIKRSWSASLALAVTANAEVHVYVDSAGVVTASTSNPMATNTIHLATCRTSATDVVMLTRHTVPLKNIAPLKHMYAREVVGPIHVSGVVVTVNTPPSLKLDVDAGTYYIFDTRRTVGATTPITFTYWYRDGSGGWKFATAQTDIDAANYDDGSGTLAAIPAGDWKKDLLFVASSDSGVEYHVVYGQETFTTQVLAENGNNPAAGSTLLAFSLRLAGVVVQKDATDITTIKDERPKLGQLSSGATAVTDHGNLGGLADDDHPQYQLDSEKNAANGYAGLDGGSLLNPAQVPDGADATAIHDDVSAEISAITEKTTPVNGDHLLIEDSAASNAKKRVQIGNLPVGSFTSGIVEATSQVTTTSSTDVLIGSMTVTPASGDYLVWLSGECDHSQENSAVYVNIYSGGTKVAASERAVTIKQGSLAFACYAKVTVNGSQAIEGKFRRDAGTSKINERQLMYLKV